MNGREFESLVAHLHHGKQQVNSGAGPHAKLDVVVPGIELAWLVDCKLSEAQPDRVRLKLEDWANACKEARLRDFEPAVVLGLNCGDLRLVAFSSRILPLFEMLTHQKMQIEKMPASSTRSVLLKASEWSDVHAVRLFVFGAFQIAVCSDRVFYEFNRGEKPSW